MRFFGKVGYCFSQEGTGDRVGIFEDIVVERNHYGDVISNKRRYDAQSESVLDNVVINNQISIIADGFSMEHLNHIKYVEWSGCKWKVTAIEIQRPRLILQLGGVYNGPEADTA